MARSKKSSGCYSCCALLSSLGVVAGVLLNFLYPLRLKQILLATGQGNNDLASRVEPKDLLARHGPLSTIESAPTTRTSKVDAPRLIGSDGPQALASKVEAARIIDSEGIQQVPAVPVKALASAFRTPASQELHPSPMKDESTEPLAEEEPSAAARGTVMYAIFTSALPKYRQKLEAIRDTWGAKVIAQDRFFAFGGRGYPKKWLQKGVVYSSNCADSHGGLSCKEATLIAEGFKRGASWLFITGEDNYVDTDKMDTLLKRHNPDENVALGYIGCGRGIDSFCPQVRNKGGFCGGCGYALSRESLRRLMEKGFKPLVKEYGEIAQTMPNGREVKAPRSELDALELQAFDRGCSIGMNTSHWMQQWGACLAKKSHS